jgi:hypothetical protein
MSDDADVPMRPVRRLPDLLGLPPQVVAVERAIDELVFDFRRHPFIHRVEHSLHVHLYSLLLNQVELADRCPIGKTGYVTSLVHKEWPETRHRRARRRGSFDLAVLAPAQLEVASVQQFMDGKIAPPIVIECGLGYDDAHLRRDAQKLLHSRVAHPYLIHFSFKRSTKQRAVEALIVELQPQIKVAYVHHDIANKKVYLKGLDEPAVSEWLEPSAPDGSS